MALASVFTTLLMDNEKKLSMVVISPRRLYTRNVFRDPLDMEHCLHWKDNQNDHLETWWIEHVPPDSSILLWISFR